MLTKLKEDAHGHPLLRIQWDKRKKAAQKRGLFLENVYSMISL